MKQSLNNHLPIHEIIEGEKVKKAHVGIKHKCDQCDYTSNFTNNIKNHKRRVHEGEKNETCATCGKAFFRHCDLERHIALGKFFLDIFMYA